MLSVAVALLGVLFVCNAARADDYPTKPIMLVVPFPAGGGNDALARAVAERMSRTLGQQVVVENRAAGGGGTVATRAAAKAAPDGYTIILTYTGTLAINPTLYPNAGYDPRKDFAPIGLIGVAAERADHASVAAGALDRGAGRLRQGQSRQDQLWLRGRHDRAHDHRAVREKRRLRDHPRSLQGQRRRDRRSDRRAHQHDGAVDPGGRTATYRRASSAHSRSPQPNAPS